MAGAIRDVRDLSLPHLPGTKKSELVEGLRNVYQQRVPAQKLPGLAQGKDREKVSLNYEQ